MSVGLARKRCVLLIPIGNSIKVSLWVSVKVILADIYYYLEALQERQLTEYTRQEKGPMLC